MSGPIGLHGGGEYVAGDEPFLDALLETAATAAAARADQAEPALAAHGSRGAGAHVVGSAIRVVILPTAAARGVPDGAAANGRAAFERRAAHLGRAVVVEVARIVDALSAEDPHEAARLGGADLIHLPGGDPDLLPWILAGSRAMAAIDASSRRGAVIAGASAGAMALAEWTWTPAGGIRGLGLVRGAAIVPHYDDIRRTEWQRTLDDLAPGGIGYLGLDERTGVISEPDSAEERVWRVVGPGTAWWFARGSDEPIVGRHGDRLRLPA